MKRHFFQGLQGLARLFSSRLLQLLLAAGLGFATFGFLGAVYSKPTANDEKPKMPANRLALADDAAQLSFLKIEAVELVPLPASDPMNARLTLAEDLTARVFTPLAGRIVVLQAAIGDSVSAGAPLAMIDAPDFGQAIADLRKAEADASLKRKSLSRAQLLFEGEALARRDLESAEAEARASAAEAERARLRLGNLVPPGSRVDGQRLILRAPLAGIVADRQANPGTEVRPDAANPLFVVSDLRQLWLAIDLPEKAIANAKPDASVRFTVDAYPGEEFSARIERVGALVDPATRRIPVRAVVDNHDGRLKPEMYARASISQTDAQQALRLPVGALLTGGLTTQIFVQIGAREFERRTVRLARQDAEFAYLAPDTGLKPGEQVVVRGAMLLASEMAQGE